MPLPNDSRFCPVTSEAALEEFNPGGVKEDSAETKNTSKQDLHTGLWSRLSLCLAERAARSRENTDA